MSATRSVAATIVNLTGQELTIQSSSLQHGSFTSSPPSQIPNNAQTNNTFLAESDGLVTGVQGEVVYQIGGVQAQTVTLLFDNPLVGGDSFSAPCNPPGSFNGVATSSNGNNATVTYTVSAG